MPKIRATSGKLLPQRAGRQQFPGKCVDLAVVARAGGLNRWLQHPSMIFVGVVVASRLSPLEREQ
ncbi:hypothetical protein V6V47_31625, partial [Micromonospora sp. CPCC 205539]|uniref:hypothetical protein n=1 Tax=Micromonospora sp. CPCC 205539 TaxID=3122408 RepID=UPI002FF2657C